MYGLINNFLVLILLCGKRFAVNCHGNFAGSFEKIILAPLMLYRDYPEYAILVDTLLTNGVHEKKNFSWMN